MRTLEKEISSGPDEFGSEFGLFNHSLLQMHHFVATVYKLMISFQYHPGIPSYPRETEPIHYVLCSGQKKESYTERCLCRFSVNQIMVNFFFKKSSPSLFKLLRLN